MRNNYNLMYMADFYKVSHKAQYPANVTKVHSVLVARGANYNEHISKTEFQWFGAKLFIEKLESFSEWFFSLPYAAASIEIEKYKDFLDARLGGNNNVAHWFDLRLLGHLPLIIKAQPEKAIQAFQTPLITVENTDDNFAWLTSYIETSMLSNVWAPCTAANRSWHIRKSIEDVMQGYSEEELSAIDFMAHDFSYRGLQGDEAAMLSGCGHLANFKGSDSIPAILAMERVYGEITGFSVPATEHSVMCAGGEEDEVETFKRILDIYPQGIVSVVADTWDYYGMLKNLASFKDRIMARDGKLVIRPDSGDPVHIICGDVFEDYSNYEFGHLKDYLADIIWDLVAEDTPHGEVGVDSWDLKFKHNGKYYVASASVEFDRHDKQYYYLENVCVDEIEEISPTPEQQGSLEILDSIFGHTLDSAGLKVLDSHIGLIYGDGMNQERIKKMLAAMIAKGYSPLNIVFGVGAYTYQLTTRDELGFAFKATAVEIDGEWVSIQKNPKTDVSKKSLTGRFDGADMEVIFNGKS
ncbi:MAG: nicotinate phosphoribosyltransferase [Alphaproteobacteria bacterium]|nr:nicotinate phosphoribosyltransferase [Alphaproteobacteria bacterium]